MEEISTPPEQNAQKNSLTSDEARRHAQSIFPKNPRASQLLEKSLLGPLTPDEQKELNDFFSRREMKKRFSEEVISLFNRYKEKDLNVVYVDMNSVGGEVSVAQDDSEKVIFTSGLGGCYASLLYFEQPDGLRNAVLVHFDPAIPTEQLSAVVLLKRAESLGISGDSRTVLLIEAPGRWVKNAEGKWVLSPLNQEKTEGLRKNILEGLRDKVADVEIITEVYPMASEAKDHGVLRVHIPSFSGGEASYKTWFSSGTLAKSKTEE